MKIYFLKSAVKSIFIFAIVLCQKPPVYAPIEGIAAIVGENIILKSEVAQYLNMALIQQGVDPRTDLETTKQIEAGIVSDLVDQKVILELAELDSIEVDDKNVDRALDQRVDGFIAQLGSEEAVEKALGQPLRSYRREFWYDMRDYLVSDTYRQQLISNIVITRNDVTHFFESFKDSLPSFPSMVKIRHALINVEPDSHAVVSTVEKLSQIKEKILSGASFSELAEKYSQDPGSKKSGGSLGFVRRGNLVKEFEATAFTLESGEISDPVKTVFGYHIIETEEVLGDRIKVRHILLSPEITEQDESRAFRFASSLRDSAGSLDDFIKIARIHSQDTKTKETGGSLGWIDPQRFPIKEIGMVINQINMNTCGGPVRSELGYHLIWIEAFKPGGAPSLKNHWAEIEAMALNHKKSQWFQEWMKNARKKVYISRAEL